MFGEHRGIAIAIALGGLLVVIIVAAFIQTTRDAGDSEIDQA